MAYNQCQIASDRLQRVSQREQAMNRTFFALFVVAAIGIGGMTLAGHDSHGKGKAKVKTLSARDMAEKLDGKKSRVTMLEVTLEPGQSSPPHRHPGPVFGYVLEGEYEWAIDEQPSRTLKVGDTFYEPSRCLHRVSKNPSARTKTRVLAVLLHPHDVKDLVIPEKPAKKE
jgi:quercetin dioxygenase-like cupin family protein